MSPAVQYFLQRRMVSCLSAVLWQVTQSTQTVVPAVSTHCDIRTAATDRQVMMMVMMIYLPTSDDSYHEQHRGAHCQVDVGHRRCITET